MKTEPEKYVVYAAEALSKCGDKTAIPMLLTMLDHTKSDIQVSVMLALGNLEGKEVIPSLIQKLESTHENIQITAAYILGNLDAHAALPTLERLAQDIYEATRVRQSAIKAIGKLSLPTAQLVLQNIINTEKDQEIVEICRQVIIVQQG